MKIIKESQDNQEVENNLKFEDKQEVEDNKESQDNQEVENNLKFEDKQEVEDNKESQDNQEVDDNQGNYDNLEYKVNQKYQKGEKCENNKSFRKLNYKNNLESGKEEENEKICRICYDSDSKETLYNPCKCCGSIKWVHTSCLNKWISISEKNKCSQCHYEYKFEKKYKYKFLKYLDNNIAPKIITLILLITLIILSGIFGLIVLKVLKRRPKYFSIKFGFNLPFIFFGSKYFACLFFFVALPLLYYFKFINFDNLFEDLGMMNQSYYYNGNGEIILFIYRFFFKRIQKILKNLINNQYVLKNYS